MIQKKKEKMEAEKGYNVPFDSWRPKRTSDVLQS